MARVRGTHMQANGSQGHAHYSNSKEMEGGRRVEYSNCKWGRGWTLQDTAEQRGRGAGGWWTVDATQNVSDIICQNKLFDVVASQRKCVHRRPPCPHFPVPPVPQTQRAWWLPPWCVQLSSSFVYPSSLSTPLLPPSLPVLLFCCVCLQTTTNCCLMHDRLMPPAPWPHATCHLPLALLASLASRLPSAIFIIIIATRVQRSAKILLVRGLVSSVST